VKAIAIAAREESALKSRVEALERRPARPKRKPAQGPVRPPGPVIHNILWSPDLRHLRFSRARGQIRANRAAGKLS
jgi:hypothetical protein